MRGRSTCPTGQEKNPAGATDESLPFSTRKGWVQGRPLIRPGCAGPPSPKGKALGVGVSLQGIQSPSVQRTRPAGHASQSSAGRSRRKRIKSCFDRLRRPKHTSQPPVCPQGARSGCNPPILGGASHQAGNLTPPYSALPNEAQTPLAPPKILTARRSASPPDPPASAAPPQPGGSGPGSGLGSRWPSGPGGRRGPRCWSFSRSSPGPLGWTGWS